MFFELQLKSLFILNFVFWVFEDIRFPFYGYITFSTSFIHGFGNSLCCIFPVCWKEEYYLKIFGFSLDFNDFCRVEYFLEFVIFKFFSIFYHFFE